MIFLWILIFPCFGFISGSDSNNNNTKDRLVFTQIIFRHGARSILYTYPNDPYKNEIHWPEGLGQLTNLGKQQEYELGKFFRRRYEKLLGDGSYSPNKVFAVSSDKDRTINSAALVLAGLFPPKNDQVWNKDLLWQPIPVHVIPSKDDYLIYRDFRCLRFQEEMKKLEKTPKVQELYEKNRELFEYINENTGAPIQNLIDAYEIYITLLVEHQNNKILPEWTKDVFFPGCEMQYIAEFAIKLMSETTELKKFMSGSLLKEILDNFQTKSLSKLQPDRLLWLYSGHDVTIATMLNTLGVFENHLPPYASSIHFEMFESNGEFYLKIFYRNTTNEHLNPLDLPNCGTKCPLNRFFDLYRDILPMSKSEVDCQLVAR